MPSVVQSVAYPAAHPESIAIGASSDRDYRSDYSEFGAQLAVVAPSGGGPFNFGITTTDRTGTAGYNTAAAPAGNYTSTFSGTSSATPLAAGVVGLMLSRNGNITEAQVRQILQSSADKVGPEPYAGGRNDRYGYGRVNAYAAVSAVSLPPTVTSFTPTSGPVGTSVTITGTNFTGATQVQFNTTDATTTRSTPPPDHGHRARRRHHRHVNVTTPGGTATGPGSLHRPRRRPDHHRLHTRPADPSATSVDDHRHELHRRDRGQFNTTNATTTRSTRRPQITATVAAGATTAASG